MNPQKINERVTELAQEEGRHCEFVVVLGRPPRKKMPPSLRGPWLVTTTGYCRFALGSPHVGHLGGAWGLRTHDGLCTEPLSICSPSFQLSIPLPTDSTQCQAVSWEVNMRKAVPSLRAICRSASGGRTLLPHPTPHHCASQQYCES